MNEHETRQLLNWCIDSQDPKAAKSVLLAAILEGQPIQEWTDIHFSLLLLMVRPQKESRGRRKNPGTKIQDYFFNLACKLKADITGSSFSSTWETFCAKTRPKMADAELWRCAGLLKMGVEENMREADIAIRQFGLSQKDLQSYGAVEK